MCCGPLMGQVAVSAPMGMQGNVSQTVNVSNTGGGQSHDHTLSANFSGSANSVLQP